MIELLASESAPPGVAPWAWLLIGAVVLYGGQALWTICATLLKAGEWKSKHEKSSAPSQGMLDAHEQLDEQRFRTLEKAIEDLRDEREAERRERQEEHKEVVKRLDAILLLQSNHAADVKVHAAQLDDHEREIAELRRKASGQMHAVKP